MLSKKYGRTYHYPFSPGTTSDNRINHTYWEDIQQIETLIHTEKLDGENNCLSRYGVFARNVFKYVRKGHVKTDEHWTRNWKRARLIWEIGKEE